jgi:drug/metabolite transporter (DMT)-like permease
LRNRDLGMRLLLGSLWGTAFLFITLGLRSFSPLLFAAFRFDISGAFLLGMAALLGQFALPRGRKQWLAVGIAGAFNVAAYHGFLFWGQQFTNEGVAAVIVGLNPVLTTVFSRWLLEDERVGPRGMLGLLLGFAGIALLALLKPGQLLDAQGIGELAVVAAIASWAMGSVLVKRTKHGMGVFAFTGFHSLVGALILHASSFALEGGGRAVFDPNGIESLLYLAVVSSGIGFAIYYALMEHVGPIRLNLVSHIAPIFANVAGIIALGDAPQPRAAIAFVLIVSGFSLVIQPAPARAPPPASARAEPEPAPLDAEP